MAKLTELEGRLDTIEKNLDEAATEITTEITTLREALGNTDIPEAATASLDRLEAKSKALADVVPDAPTGSPTPGGNPT